MNQILKQMITLKINLLELKGSLKLLKGKTEELECFCIPIDLNHIYRGEKGLYLDMIAFEIKQPKEGQGTHLIKQSLPKEVREKMSDEEKNSQPILGNMRITEFTEKEPVSSTTVTSESDDLPFSFILPLIGSGLIGLLSGMPQIMG